MDYFYYNHQFYPQETRLISYMDRGFALGDGIFETIKVSDGLPELYEAHITRLLYGAYIMQLDPPQENLYDMIQELLEKNHQKECVVKIILSRQALIRGLSIINHSQANLLLHIAPLPAQISQLKICISEIRRNETSPLSQVKSLNYGDQILALNQAQKKGFDDAIMLNFQGQPCCFTAGNLVIETSKGQLITPAPETGCLRGCYLSSRNDISYGDIDLKDAVKIWRSNSLTGLIPASFE